MAMSDAERQKKRRERLRSEGKHTLLVRGANGEYDERIGIAFAVKKLAEQKMIPEEILNLIIDVSSLIFENDETEISKKRYMKKIVRAYLSTKEKD